MMRHLWAPGLALILAACTVESAVEDDDGASGGGGGTATSTTTSASITVAATTTTGGGNEPETTAQSLARQQMEKGWGTSQCAAGPNGEAVGTAEGEQILDLTFKDCEGNDVSLRELCGADGVWMFFAHVWCPHCRLTGSFAEEVHDGFAGENLATVQVVVADGNGDPADASTCQLWRDEYGQQDVLTLYDPTGAYQVLLDESFTALNVLLDQNQLIQPKFHSDQRSGIESAIQSALAQ